MISFLQTLFHSHFFQNLCLRIHKLEKNALDFLSDEQTNCSLFVPVDQTAVSWVSIQKASWEMNTEKGRSFHNFSHHRQEQEFFYLWNCQKPGLWLKCFIKLLGVEIPNPPVGSS